MGSGGTAPLCLICALDGQWSASRYGRFIALRSEKKTRGNHCMRGLAGPRASEGALEKGKVSASPPPKKKQNRNGRMASSGILRRVALVRTDVSEELGASFIRVTRTGELGTTLAVTSNRRTLQTNFFAVCVGC
jgi:hypothetical protein